MATTSIVIEASPADVFAVLSDGWTYSNWVVGTSHIRAVQANWPSVGSRLYHAVGAWPMVTRDYSEVEKLEPDSEIVLYASGSKLGSARIRITVEPHPDGSQVAIHETPVDGPGKWLHNPLQDVLLHRRNIESLHRLRATVRRFTEPPE